VITVSAIKQVGLSNISEGQLPAYAWPGGYPLYYLDKDNGTLCPACATSTMNLTEPPFNTWEIIIGAGINYEDTHCYCDECSKRIESAYAED
jgi:hypothetical protein